MAKLKPETQEASIDFGQGQSSLEELSGAAPIFLNMLADAGGAVRQRPGMRAWADFAATIPNASPVVCMYAWRTFLLYVCEDRTIWAYYGSGDIRALSDTTAATKLDGALRPIFAYDFQRVVITGGGAPQKWEGAGLTARLGGDPPVATHIGYSSQRLAVNLYDNTGVIQWTPPGVGNHEVWTTAGVNSGGFAEAEAAADPVLAIYVNTNELFAFGTQTLQVFTPDDVNDFSVASTLALGCGARYSVIDTDSSFAWLDERHRFVTSSGRDFQAISSPGMAKAVSSLAVTSDCWGFRSRIGSFDLLCWVFPTEQRMLVYDRGSQKWGEWKSWDGVQYVGWLATSYYYWAEQNIHLVGLADGTIAEMTFDAFKDMTYDIKAISRTGFMDVGIGNRKLCQRLQVQMKRSAAPANDNAIAEIRYRDDLGAFGVPVNFPLGSDYAPTLNKYAIGMFRERQWELAFQNNAECVLTGARVLLEPGDS